MCSYWTSTERWNHVLRYQSFYLLSSGYRTQPYIYIVVAEIKVSTTTPSSTDESCMLESPQNASLIIEIHILQVQFHGTFTSSNLYIKNEGIESNRAKDSRVCVFNLLCNL